MTSKVYQFSEFRKNIKFIKKARNLRIDGPTTAIAAAAVGVAAGFNQAYRSNGGMSIGTAVEGIYNGLFMGMFAGCMGYFIGDTYRRHQNAYTKK